MQRKILRIFAIMLIGFLCFGVLTLFVNFYQSHFYQHPLEKELTQIEGLEITKFNQEKNGLFLEISFNSRENLRANFYALLKASQTQKGVDLKNCVWQINNKKTEPELSDYIKKAKLIVYEAISTGHFTVLPEQLALLAQASDLTYDWAVDPHFVFITVSKEEYFAHLVVKRGDFPLEIITMWGEEYL